MKAAEITTAATNLVGGDRARTHGDKTENHQVIARFWNAWLDSRPSGSLDAHDVANMMELLKVARRLRGAFNIDDYVDGAGYAAVAGEIAAAKEAEQQRKDQSWADAAVADTAIEGCPAGPVPTPATFGEVCDAMRRLLAMTETKAPAFAEAS
jgi:hypothetical protein